MHNRCIGIALGAKITVGLALHGDDDILWRIDTDSLQFRVSRNAKLRRRQRRSCGLWRNREVDSSSLDAY